MTSIEHDAVEVIPQGGVITQHLVYAHRCSSPTVEVLSLVSADEGPRMPRMTAYATVSSAEAYPRRTCDPSRRATAHFVGKSGSAPMRHA